MIAAVAVTGGFLDAQEVIRGYLGREPFERAVGRTDDLEDRSAGQRSEVVESADLQLAILGEGGWQWPLCRIRARDVHEEDVDRHPPQHRAAYDFLQIRRRFGDETLRQQDERLLTLGLPEMLH